jgi:hypothetical protein
MIQWKLPYRVRCKGAGRNIGTFLIEIKKAGMKIFNEENILFLTYWSVHRPTRE